MIWALTLLIGAIVFSPRVIAYLVPVRVGLTCIGLLFFWPHTPEWMHSLVAWGIGTLIGSFLFAIAARLFLGVPIMAGTIGFAAIGLIGEAAPIIGKVWHAVTHTVTAAIGAITPAHWVIAGGVIVGLILVECWKARCRRVPHPLTDDDDDDPTDTRLVLRLAPLRAPSRAERKAAAIYAEIERKAKLSAAWQAWHDGRGPRPF